MKDLGGNGVTLLFCKWRWTKAIAKCTGNKLSNVLFKITNKILPIMDFISITATLETLPPFCACGI